MSQHLPLPGPTPSQPAVCPESGASSESWAVAESSTNPIADPWAANHFAVTHLAYDARQLSKLPRSCAAGFRGVANPHRVGPIAGGERVLDHACGGGLDLLLAALRFGARGEGTGVEQDPALLNCAQQCSQQCAQQSAGECGQRSGEQGAQRPGQTGFEAPRLHWLQGTPTSLPLPRHSVDVVLSNGALGGPCPQLALREIVRVLRPGGRLHLGVRVGLEPTAQPTEGRAVPWVAEPVAPLLYGVGFRRVQLVERFLLGAGPLAVGESFLAQV